MKKFVNQWGIYMVDLGKGVGSIQGGVRPCLILQNAIGNAHSPTTLVAPITSAIKSLIPPHCELSKQDYPFLKYDINTILFEQMQPVNIQTQVLRYLGMVKDGDKKFLLDTFLKNFILERE